MFAERLSPFAAGVWARLVNACPEWLGCLATIGDGDLEVAIPAPAGSQAGHLVVATCRGEDLWVRYSPPHMCYPLDDEDELLSIVRQLLHDEALFLVKRKGDAWSGTTLIKPDAEPDVEPGEVAYVVSWSGTRDRVVTGEA